MTKHMTRRTALRGIATIAAAGGATAALAATDAPDGLPPAPDVLEAGPDAELLRFGEQFRRAFSREMAISTRYSIGDEWPTEAYARWDIEFAECSRLARLIELTPALTLAGLQVKALAVRWCYGDDLPLDDRDATTDIRLAGSIVRDLLKMGRVV